MKGLADDHVFVRYTRKDPDYVTAPDMARKQLRST
jgi:hypothetical protein